MSTPPEDTVDITQPDLQEKTPMTPHFILPQNPTRAVQEMISIVEDMIAVYERETEALDTADTQNFSVLQNEKLEIAQKYQLGVQQIVARKEQMATVDRALKEKLQSLQNTFATLTQKNLGALKRMGRATERLGNVIREAARAAVQKQRGHSYGETGVLSQGANKRVSMGINETA